MVNHELSEFCNKARKELFGNIIPFWLKHSRDQENGGFYGRITNDLRIEKKAPKGLVQTSRILWTFSALYQLSAKDEYLEMAHWAYQFLIDKYFDDQFGGVFWLLDYKGNVVEDKKKIYGQAFTIFALAEYNKVSQNDEALARAFKLFHVIEENNYDDENKGYYETSNRDWSISEDMRLSEIDMNEKKSMNTHLHLMEAYTTLYQVCPHQILEFKLRELIDDFTKFILDPDTKHLILFFDEFWRKKSENISFGHDIEGSWLLCEAAKVLGDKDLIENIDRIALDMVNVTIQEGFSDKFSIYVEKCGDGSLDRSVHWWQQAEAVVGLVNAFQISEGKQYLEWALKCWQFIEDFIIDRSHGEWFYEIKQNCHPDHKRHKVSEWKGPYHNARACMEIVKRLESGLV